MKSYHYASKEKLNVLWKDLGNVFLFVMLIALLFVGCDSKQPTANKAVKSPMLYEDRKLIYDAANLGYKAGKEKWPKEELDSSVSGLIVIARIPKYQTMPEGATHICIITQINGVPYEDIFFVIAATPEILDAITKTSYTSIGRCWEISSRKEYKP